MDKIDKIAVRKIKKKGSFMGVRWEYLVRT